MEKINARVLLIMDKLGKSKSELAREISVSPSIMSHITSGRNKVGLDVLQKIGEVFPQISSQWLLHGTGNMFAEADTAKLSLIQAELKQLKTQADELEAAMTVLRRGIDKTRDLIG
jgi:plasmid maintenance system antidote protein VapI